MTEIGHTSASLIKGSGNWHCTSPGHPRRVSHPDMAIREGHLQEQARWSTHTLGSDIVRHRCLAKLHSAVLHNTTSTLLGATNYKQHVGMLSSYEVICHFESNSQLLCWESGRFSRCALLLTLVPLVVSKGPTWFLMVLGYSVGNIWTQELKRNQFPDNSGDASILGCLQNHKNKKKRVSWCWLPVHLCWLLTLGGLGDQLDLLPQN